MKKIYFRSKIETEDKPMRLKGYAYRFGDEGFADGMREEIMKGAFTRSISEEIDSEIFMYQNHDPTKPLGKRGKNLMIEEDDKGLRFEVNLPDTSMGRDAYELVKSGIMDGMSVGMSDVKDKYDGDKRFITEARLDEVSLTQIPVYKQTSVEARSKKDILLPPSLW